MGRKSVEADELNMDVLDQACVNYNYSPSKLSSVNMKKFWTAEEVSKLMKFVSSHTPSKVIAEELGRSVESVKNKIYKSKLTLEAWSKAEEEQLKHMLNAGMTYEEIAKELKRTREAIRIRAMRLNIARKYELNSRPRFSLSNLSVAEKAYIAGFLDGEGSFGIQKSGYPFVIVANSDKSVINWISEKVGYGTKWYVNDARGNRKPMYSFRIQTYADIIEFIEAIIPYLKVKKQQAQLLKEYCELRLKSPLRNPLTGKMTLEGRMLEIYKTMKNLNKRGT